MLISDAIRNSIERLRANRRNCRLASSAISGRTTLEPAATNIDPRAAVANESACFRPYQPRARPWADELPDRGSSIAPNHPRLPCAARVATTCEQTDSAGARHINSSTVAAHVSRSISRVAQLRGLGKQQKRKRAGYNRSLIAVAIGHTNLTQPRACGTLIILKTNYSDSPVFAHEG